MRAMEIGRLGRTAIAHGRALSHALSWRAVCASVPALLLAFAAAAPRVAGAAAPYPATMCPADRLATDLNCTANDVEVASVQVLNNVTTCIAGDQVSLHLQANLHANAQLRYNVGIFMAQDGRSTLLTSADGGSQTCSTFGLPTSPLPFTNADQNVCGDFDSSGLPQGQTTPLDLGTVTVTCTPDAEGYLDIPTIVTWNTNANTAGCQAPPVDWFVPENKSKCEAGISQRIEVQVFGKIEVTKKTTPSGSPAAFSFSASGPAAAPTQFSLSDGQSQTVQTAQLGAAPQTYVITEQQLAGWEPGAQIVCLDKDGDNAPFVTIDNINGKVTANMSVSADQVYCTYTNTQQSSITINKVAVGGDGSFDFAGSPGISPFSIATTGGSGQATLTGLAPGTYSISEAVPAGWDLTGLTCVDPTNDSSTNPASGTATIVLAPGENVACTYTDTRRASITVVKNTVGANGTFTFSGPQSPQNPSGTFQITTSGGTGQVTLTNLVPGNYPVSESVPSGWDLTNLSCVDPSGGTTTNANTASVALAPGENVTCTFTDTRRGAIVVQKQVAGADATFNFTGAQSFSIATAGGFGQNTAAFASVAPGQYAITESPLAHYSLTGLACADPSNDSATNLQSGTATVNVAAGETVVCTFTNTQLATLTIIKSAVPQVAQNPQSFAFTTSGTGLSNFSLTDDGTNPNSITFSDLAPGTAYSVTETAVASWPLTSLTCTDEGDPNPANRSPINLGTRTVQPNLQPGETLRCAFTNVRNDNGTIVVTKRTIGTLAAGTGGAFDFSNSGGSVGSQTNPATFTITTTVQNPAVSRSLTGLAAMQYTITETPLAGWDPAQPYCVVTNGSNTTFQYTATSVTITLGTTGGNVDAAACTFENTHRGGITIIKQSTPQDPQAFTFDTTGGNGVPASFQLVDNGGTNSQNFPSLVPAVYTFTEQATSGWKLNAIACSGGASVTTDLASGLATIDLKAGESVTCTYQNAKNGTITIHKVALGGGPNDTFAFTGPQALTGSIGNGGSLSGSFAAGTYSVTELVPAGWDITNIACSGGSVTITGAGSSPTNGFEAGDTTVNITIASGEAVSCTYTDTKRAAITIVKNTIGGDGAFAFTGAQSFQIQTASGSGQNATAFASVSPGTYAVTEQVPAGWKLTALTCSNASPTSLANATATVQLAAGESVTCTFTDTRLGTIRIVKRIESENSNVFSFAVPTSMDPSGTFALAPAPDATAARTFDNLVPGSYAVTETVPSGWLLLGIACSDPTSDSAVNVGTATATIALAAGETVECTFDDTQLATIILSVVTTGGTGTFDFNTTNLGANSLQLTTTAEGTKASRTFANVPPGTYALDGISAAGWQFDGVVCLAQSGEVYWTIAGMHVGITIPHGEVIECTYFFSKTAPPPPPRRVPVLAPWLYVVVGLGLAAMGSRRLRTRR